MYRAKIATISVGYIEIVLLGDVFIVIVMEVDNNDHEFLIFYELKIMPEIYIITGGHNLFEKILKNI